MTIPKCVRCGYPLDDCELKRFDEGFRPPACDDCLQEVYEEIDKDLPVWPSDWYGHGHLTNEGRWVVTPDSSHI